MLDRERERKAVVTTMTGLQKETVFTHCSSVDLIHDIILVVTIEYQSSAFV